MLGKEGFPSGSAEGLLPDSTQRASSQARHRGPPLRLCTACLLSDSAKRIFLSGSSQMASSRTQQGEPRLRLVVVDCPFGRGGPGDVAYWLWRALKAATRAAGSAGNTRLGTEGLLSSSAERASRRARKIGPPPRPDTEPPLKFDTEGLLSTSADSRHGRPRLMLGEEGLLSSSAKRASSQARHR